MSNTSKNILRTFLPFLGIMILIIFALKFGTAKINDLRLQISEAQTNKRKLTEKIDILRSMESIDSSASQLVTTGLPGENSSLMTLTQLKNATFVNSVMLSNLKVGAETKDMNGLLRADISFDLLGPKNNVVSFLRAIENTAPIALVDRIKISEVMGVSHARVAIKTFWSELPEKMPAVTDTINALTVDEKEILARVVSLSQPYFSQLTPSSDGGKSDPFTQ